MTWIEKDKYYLQNGSATICKVWLNGKVSYELWHQGTQYAGMKTVDEAKLRYERLAK